MAVVVLQAAAGRWRRPGFPLVLRCFASADGDGSGGAGRLSSQLGSLASSQPAPRAAPTSPQQPAKAQPSKPKERLRVVAADRSFLLGSSASGAGAGGHQVLIHDYRDLKYLKQVSAIGIASTLMSSSGLAYAVSMDLGAAMCGGLAFQTVSAGLMLGMYLRTYVARAVLDTRRSRLLITGCGLFGEPLTSEQELPLMAIKPNPEVTDPYIKFATRGAAIDPSSWIWYRMPRAQLAETGARKRGAQVGFAPAVSALALRPEQEKLKPTAQGAAGPQGRHFPGAGLGAAEADDDGFGGSGLGGPAAAPAVPGPRRDRGSAAEAGEAPSAFAEAAASREPLAERKSLADLRLLEGLPRDAREEQKIIDFFEDPLAYGSLKVQR